MHDERINKAYIDAHLEIEQEIERLRDQLAEHNQTSRINWGHVGDLKYILSQLKQLNGEE